MNDTQEYVHKVELFKVNDEMVEARPMNAITYKENYNGEVAYIQTWYGFVEIVGISDQYWARSKKDNFGFHTSHCLHKGTVVWLQV